MAAWKDRLADAGFEVQDRHWVEGKWSSESGAQALEKLLEQYPEMDSIFVSNDQMALGSLLTLHARGLRIPEDIGLVGFDNIPESAYFLPPLTTIQQDQYYVAKVAVQEIIKIIELGWQGLEADYPQSIIVPPTLVVRESSLRLNEKEGGALIGI